ncbi:MAG: hypothetical protein JXB05_06595 [Myxococcaceae bacterium]|nr:hypothetical protein [Myxococcaceae bacterium]
MRRSFLLWFGLLSAIVLGGCKCGGSGGCDESRPGESGGCCRPDGCNDGFSCVETSCRPCGAAGAGCCYTPTSMHGVCDSGLRCVSPAMGPEVCQACGMPGGPCCDGSGSPMCGAGMACIGDVCQPSSGLCPAGSARFPVGITDPNGCGLRVISVDTDTFEHAVQCASTMLAAGEAVYSDAPGTLQDYSLCVHTRMEGARNASVRAFDDHGARTCGCMGVILGCTVDYTACPGT